MIRVRSVVSSSSSARLGQWIQRNSRIPSIPLCTKADSSSASPNSPHPIKPPKAPPSTFQNLLDLSKFRLSSLVVVTTSVGFLAAGLPIDFYTLTTASVGTALCSASASTFNQIIEVENDKEMKRTMLRPLPAGRVSIPLAQTWGVATAIGGVGLLYATTNPAVALLGAGNIILYAGLYTYSKRYSEMNTWIGSVVGAVPPLMGWLAATHPLISSTGGNPALPLLASQDPLFLPALTQYGVYLTGEPLALASLLYLWQFPHFFALSYLYREDYQRGGFEMVSCNDPTGIRSARYILQYSGYLTLFPIVTSVLGYTSYMFSIEASVVNLYLLYLSQQFYSNRSNANAKKIFMTSLWYLPLLLLGFVFHSRIYNHIKEDESDRVTEEGGLERVLVKRAKEQMKDLCIHEKLVNKEHLCLKVNSDKAVENVGKAVGQVEELVQNSQEEKEKDRQ